LGIELTLINWLLAALPIILLLVGILGLKWSTYKTGAITFIVTWVLGYTLFGADQKILLLASSKGLSLALYVLLIIWGAILLYNIADQAGAIKVIGGTISKVTDNKLHQMLLLAWCFTSLLQGLAGFGVPIAVVAPILVIMGFNPMMAVTACLLGHSWAISFGSMGSSYNSIQLVTNIPGEVIGPQMALLFILPIFATGFAVAHIYGGLKAVKKSFVLILITGSVMSFMLWLLNFVGMSQISTLGAAMGGCISTVLYSRLTDKTKRQADAEKKEGMGFVTACFPYLSLIVISIISQIPFIKSALSKYAWGLDYPAMETKMGYIVAEASMYSKIQIFSHPAPILFLSAALGYLVYTGKAGVSKDILGKALKATVKKSVPTSVGIATMVMMALIMSDTGMTYLLARGIAMVFGQFYPIASPFIGVLGSFLTGSNTNSNIMFGMLQYETAEVIGKSSVIMAAVQSVGGSLGVSISPSSIMMGASNVGLTGKESGIMAITIKYCLVITFLLGLIVFAVTL
jgi:lactate permease